METLPPSNMHTAWEDILHGTELMQDYPFFRKMQRNHNNNNNRMKN